MLGTRGHLCMLSWQGPVVSHIHIVLIFVRNYVSNPGTSHSRAGFWMTTRSLLNNILITEFKVWHYYHASQMMDSDLSVKHDCFLSAVWTALPASNASLCWNHWLEVVELLSALFTSQVPGCLRCLTICIHWLRGSVCTRVQHSNLCLSLAPLDLCALATTIQHLLVGAFLLLTL